MRWDRLHIDFEDLLASVLAGEVVELTFGGIAVARVVPIAEALHEARAMQRVLDDAERARSDTSSRSAGPAPFDPSPPVASPDASLVRRSTRDARELRARRAAVQRRSEAERDEHRERDDFDHSADFLDGEPGRPGP